MVLVAAYYYKHVWLTCSTPCEDLCHHGCLGQPNQRYAKAKAPLEVVVVLVAVVCAIACVTTCVTTCVSYAQVAVWSYGQYNVVDMFPTGGMQRHRHHLKGVVLVAVVCTCHILV